MKKPRHRASRATSAHVAARRGLLGGDEGGDGSIWGGSDARTERRSTCADCNPCPRGKLKNNCANCNPCPHGKVKYKCAACKAARAGQPALPRKRKREPEV